MSVLIIESTLGVKRHVHPINPNRREILDVYVRQRPPEAIAHVAHFSNAEFLLKLTSELVRFPLELARKHVHEDPDDGFDRSDNHLQRGVA